MLKNKFFYICILIFFCFAQDVFASPAITSFLLNGGGQNVTFNPNNGESVSIDVKANESVKFTRLYICSISQPCNGTSGNYTRYFSQSDISDTISKSWNGKKTGDTEIVPAGEYRIMVSMTEGTNDPVTAYGQYSIFVDFSSSNSTSTNNNSGSNTQQNSSTSTTNTSVVVRTVYVSAHSSPEDLSDYNEKVPFEISAGRERMALVGSPMEFNAKYNLSQKGECSPSFKWSLGDGFEALGKDIEHTYKYQGEYQVVLNGACGEYSSISRTVVKVVAPNVSMSEDNETVAISNNCKSEINIGEWKITGTNKDFIFPKDTIISAGNKISISKEDLGYDASHDKLSFRNPSDREVAFININKSEQEVKASSTLGEVLKVDSYMSVAEAEALLDEYENSSALKNTQSNITIAKEKPTVPDNNERNTNQIATVIGNSNSSSTKSFWAKIVDIPVNGLKSIAHMFYNF